MADAKIEAPFQRAKSGQVREALDRLEGLVVEGLKHASSSIPSPARSPMAANASS
jgi:hypothetical protein